MKKIYKKKKKSSQDLRVIAVVGVITAVVVMSLWLLVKAKKEATERDKIIPPYYEQKVFTKPVELEEVARLTPTKSIEEKIRLPIIMYHYVEYVKDVGDFIRKRLDINPNVFEQQLKSLKDDGYHTYFVKEVPDILAGNIYLSPKSIILTFDDGYEDFYYDVFPLLKKYQMKATIYIVFDFIGRRGFLNESEIREVLGSGLVELGSHTLDHYSLKNLSSAVAKEQIFASKEKLENLFGVKVETFAYPYGAFSKETVELVKEAGYKAALAVIQGVFQSDENLLYLSRIRPGALTGPNMIKVLESYDK